MDSSQSPTLNDQRHISTAEQPAVVDTTAELTAPPPDAAPGPRPVPKITAPTVSTGVIRQLEALAREVAVGGRDSYDQRIEKVQGGSNFSAGLPAAEPSIRVSSRDQFASYMPPIGRRSVTLASFFLVALIGVGATFAWQSQRVSTTKAPNEVGIVAKQTATPPAGDVPAQDAAHPQQAPALQTTPAPTAAATSPELVQQLEAMARDLADLRRSVERLAAKQAQLEQVAAAQEQLATKQEQMAQNIANLEALGQTIKHRTSPPPSRTVPVSPRRNTPTNASPAPTNAPPEAAAQALSEPRPVPPLPVPPDFR